MKNFGDFIQYLQTKEQKREITILSVLICCLGIVFYQLYPFPFTYPDTGAYVLSAQSGAFNIYRPMGYSYYLQMVHQISSNITFVFIISYLLNAASSLFFLYSFKYLIDLRNKYIFYSICFFVFLSPTILFTTNFLMSDGLFTTLTIFFLTTAAWVINCKNNWMIVLHLFSFVLLYNVRYAGMFYIPISMFVLFLAFHKKSILIKVSVLLLPVILFLFMQENTRKNYKSITGVNITSGFSGWLLINNAAVLIPKAKELPAAKFHTNKEQLLHNYFNTCPDSLFTMERTLTTDFMWNSELPFKQFTFYYGNTFEKPYTLSWVETGELYSSYASKMILTYPFYFFSHYYVSSFLSFFDFQPITEEKIEFVNEKMYQEYYGVQADKYIHSNSLFTNINPLRHVLHYIYWISLIAAIVYFLIQARKTDFTEKRWQTAGLFVLFIIIYIGASALACPNTTWRYALPMYVPSILFIGYIAKNIYERKQHNQAVTLIRKRTK